MKKTWTIQLVDLWPHQSEAFQFFMRFYRTPLILYCVSSPLFFGVCLLLFKEGFRSGWGLGVIEILLGIILMIPWLLVPSAMVWTYKKTWPVLSSWGVFYCAVVCFWLVGFHHYHF